MTKAEIAEFMGWAKERSIINTLDNLSTATDIANAIREAEYRGYMKAVADRRQKWIPCSERLPETESVDDWVKALVCSADGGIAVGSFNSKYGWTFIHYFDAVVAWMPLPEPWEGADDE